MFKLNNDADINGTSLRGYVSIAPATLVKLFGQPGESDGYKVSGEYVFEVAGGQVFTVYDWKQTSLYEPGYTDPIDFWESTEIHQFHIGGRIDAAGLQVQDLEKWLLDQVKKAA